MRPETGPMKFGDDWNGLFIRGDNAITFAHNLEMVLDARPGAEIARHVVLGLLRDLESCHQFDGSPPQRMKPFEKCVGPLIICLCGSTRFTEQMLVKQWELTKQGYIVLSWCALPASYTATFSDPNHIGDQEGLKEFVDRLHLRKIDLADEVLILNIGGYIGESTRRELDYALAIGKTVRLLEEPEPAEQERLQEAAEKVKDEK